MVGSTLLRSWKQSKADNFAKAETAAYQGRKVVEGIAFACFVAIENGLSAIPKDAKGKWNAGDIFMSRKKKGLKVLPSPSVFREATTVEKKEQGTTKVIEGVPERRLTHDELVDIYQRLHAWAHELNPYVHDEHERFHAKHSEMLWQDLGRLEQFLERHFIGIRGKGFYCKLRDFQGGLTKVVPLEKEAI